MAEESCSVVRGRLDRRRLRDLPRLSSMRSMSAVRPEPIPDKIDDLVVGLDNFLGQRLARLPLRLPASSHARCLIIGKCAGIMAPVDAPIRSHCIVERERHHSAKVTVPG